MARRAFTLIELLVIVTIMATMVSVSVVSIRAGQGAARIKGATRAVMAKIRHARSSALVLMQPAVVTYSTITIDDEPCAQIQVDSQKVAASVSANDIVQTLSGESIHRDGSAIVEEEGAPVIGETDGQTVEDILSAPIAQDVVRGVRIRVTMGDERLPFEQEEQKSPNRISVFSNVDYLRGKYKDAPASEKKETGTSSAPAPAQEQAAAPKEENQGPVSVVWEANGRCDPHRVWVYLDGSTPDKGLCIKVDRFGATKIVSAEDEED